MSCAFRAVLCGALLATTACSLDNTGLLAANVTSATGAVVVDIYYLGGVVRTADFDAGATLGFSKRSYVYPEGANGLPEAGWHLLHVPLPAARPVALATESVGLEGSGNAGDVSASIGYEAVTVMASAPAEASIAYRLAYSPREPAITVLSHCEGIEGC
jgi:hypothetical protein